jgi:cell fate (sporulation/competence/biofilm development) regulator YlbF (YheA/YmcA/DUF963 family)
MKRRRSAIVVSLFPFLSILACVIGVITFMIAYSVLSQIDPEAVQETEARVAEEARLGQEYLHLQKELETAEVVLTEFRKLNVSLQENKETAEARKKALDKLIVDLGRMIGNHPKKAKLLAQATQFEQRINELQPLLKERLEKIVELQAAVNKQRADAKIPRVGKVVVRPSGSGTKGKIRPVFVDCLDLGVMVHLGSEPWLVKRSDLAKNAKWLSLLKETSAAGKKTVVFLVRPNGVGTYNSARNVALKLDVNNGKIPVDGMGELDLSFFK